jgi:hypothetical protein
VTRRALGRGRVLIVIGAIVTLVGLVPSWWMLGGTVTLRESGNGFEGVGILIFLAALGLLAVVTLPFATRDGESALDRPLVYAILAVVAIGAFVWRVFEISRFSGLDLPPGSLGMWITGAGLIVVAWGAAEVLIEKPPASY